MKFSIASAALAAAIAAVCVAAPAAAVVPISTTTVKASTDDAITVKHARHRYRTYQTNVPYPGQQRGFEDPGTAYHGNINGCAEDLGYGRWEPCD